MDHANIIDTKGPLTISEALDVPLGHVRVWRSRKTIPRSRYAEIITAFPDVSLDMLKAGETPREAA
jgi:hypothetical protein